ncbi:glycine betaine ABC transporter substrate-binding protein [Paeniglutamicibacter sp. R2-26]|uniref:glycine betaine ABC transporter substrate-binding protein n=1 Tax=Paeniglutamicibacter sp. R2-26 TaxID=3144417 RepID=UPI003EE7AF05
MTPEGRISRSRRTPAARRLGVPALAAGLACGALLLGGCTSKAPLPSGQSETVRELVFAHTPDATSTTVAHAYVEMLEAAGIRASVGEASADPVAQVLDGKADVVVAGSGDLLAALGGRAPAATASAPAPAPASGGAAASATPGSVPPGADQVLRDLHAMRPDGFAVLDSAEAARTGVLVTTAATSAGKNLSTMAQLPALCPDLDFGVPETLAEGLESVLEDTLGCKPHHLVEVEPRDESTVGPLIGGQVQVLASTLDTAGIPDNGLVPVQDSTSLFVPQTLTPLSTTRQIGQDAIDAMNKVSAALKQEDLVALNRAATGRDPLEPGQAARDWLREKSLVSAP